MNATAAEYSGQIQFLPGLASSWNVSSDGETYTFNIRTGIQFSNGDSFNAYTAWEDFYLFYYASSNSTFFWVPLPIFNSSAVEFGPATLSLMNGTSLANPSSQLMALMSNSSWPVYVTSPDRIVFHLSTPFQFFLNSFVGWGSMMFDPLYIMQHGGPGTPVSPNAYLNANPPPGTGPYVMSNIAVDSSLTFTKNSGYWGNNLTTTEDSENPLIQPGQFGTIVVNQVPNPTSEYLDLSSSKAQIAQVEGANFQAVQQSPQFGYISLPYPACIVRMGLNTQIYPTNITDVRQAIVHAINYTAIIDQAVSGQAIPVMGPETPNYGQYYDPGNLPPYDFNITEANQYLSAAGFPNGTGLPTMPLVVNSGSTTWALPAAEIIQQGLAQIGIKVSLQVEARSYIVSQILTVPYGTLIKDPSIVPNILLGSSSAFCPDYLAPSDYWTTFVTNSSAAGDWSMYNSPAADTALTLLSGNNTAATLAELKIAQQQVYNAAPFAWLFAPKLLFTDGSWVYSKAAVAGLLMVPDDTGVSDLPALNTIQPG